MFENLLKEIKNKKNVFEFYKLEEEEIKDAEERLGYSFPPILRAHIADEDFLTIEMLGDSGAVKYFDEIIAVDLIDFINKMMVNPNYFI